VQEKYLATIPCNIEIYRTLQFIIFLTLSNLKKTSNRAVIHIFYKMHENRCVLLKSEMHMRLMHSLFCALQLTALIKPN